MRKRSGFLAAFALPALLLPALLLSACNTLAPPTGVERSYGGRFSLTVTHPPGGAQTAPRRDAWSGRFALAVGPQALALDLVSPLGATIARFETDAHEARLLVPADGKVRVERGPDARQLSERVLGWSLPVAGMAEWIRGRPAAGRPFNLLPPDHGNDRFEQDGWAVTVEPPDAGRPGMRLDMERAAATDAPAVALRVVLDGPQS